MLNGFLNIFEPRGIPIKASRRRTTVVAACTCQTWRGVPKKGVTRQAGTLQDQMEADSYLWAGLALVMLSSLVHGSCKDHIAVGMIHCGCRVVQAEGFSCWAFILNGPPAVPQHPHNVTTGQESFSFGQEHPTADAVLCAVMYIPNCTWSWCQQKLTASNNNNHEHGIICYVLLC